jgi:hypothetical protein
MEERREAVKTSVRVIDIPIEIRTGGATYRPQVYRLI